MSVMKRERRTPGMKAAAFVMTVLIVMSTMTFALPQKTRAATSRDTTLNLTSSMLNYESTSGSATGDPTTSSITDSAEGWSWNFGTKTLTLDGLDLSATVGDGIILPGGSEIILIGTNTISAADDGIECSGNLTISGSGSLEITAPFGILSTSGSIEIKSGTLNINSENVALSAEFGSVNITGGSVDINSDARGIYSETVTIGGNADVTITAGNSPNDNGIEASAGDISITGGKLVVNQSYHGIRTGVGDVIISGGNIQISAGAYGISSSSNVSISGSANLTITPGDSGMQRIDAANSVTISGGTVNIEGNYSQGIKAVSVTITGGSGTIDSGATPASSESTVAVHATDSLTTANVDVKGWVYNDTAATKNTFAKHFLTGDHINSIIPPNTSLSNFSAFVGNYIPSGSAPPYDYTTLLPAPGEFYLFQKISFTAAGSGDTSGASGTPPGDPAPSGSPRAHPGDPGDSGDPSDLDFHYKTGDESLLKSNRFNYILLIPGAGIGIGFCAFFCMRRKKVSGES